MRWAIARRRDVGPGNGEAMTEYNRREQARIEKLVAENERLQSQVADLISQNQRLRLLRQSEGEPPGALALLPELSVIRAVMFGKEKP